MPRLRDVNSMIKLLTYTGAQVEWVGDHLIRVDTKDAENHVAPYEIVKEMRASTLMLGALVGRLRRAVVSYPGGCAIGERPIDLHLKGLSLLGCEVRYTKDTSMSTRQVAQRGERWPLTYRPSEERRTSSWLR